MINFGPASHGLEIRVQQTKDTFEVAKYVSDTLKYFGMSDSKAAPTLLLSVNLSEFKDSDTDATLSCSSVGKLIYTANCARPDQAIAVDFLSYYMKAPKVLHFNVGKHTFCYLAQLI